MKMLIASIALITLTGCTLPSGAKFSSEHGYGIQGKIGGEKGLSGSGIPTIVPDGASPMGSRRILPDGTIEEEMFSTIVNSDGSSATGNAANIMAETNRLEKLLLICAVAGDSMACLGK